MLIRILLENQPLVYKIIFNGFHAISTLKDIMGQREQTDFILQKKRQKGLKTYLTCIVFVILTISIPLYACVSAPHNNGVI